MNALTADNLVALTVQAGVLVLVGAPLPRLFAIRLPRARLAYWRALLVACLLLPIVQPLAPAPLPSIVPQSAVRVTAEPGAAGGVTGIVPAPRPIPPINLLQLVAAGMVIRLSWFVFGLVTLRRLRRGAHALDPRPPSVDEAAGLAGADAEFRVSPRSIRPVTFGLVRPVVVVPADFASFSPEEQRAIACHELVHVRRRDWLRNVADELLRSLAWFHPAAWWLTRQIRLSREQLVDQEVVRRTGARRPYLDALLRLASPSRGSRFVPAALFLGRSHLSDRVALLLKEVHMSRLRLALSFLAIVIALAVTGRAIVAAYPLHGPSIPAARAQAPSERQSAKAGIGSDDALRKLHDVRPQFPAGSPEAPVILSLRVNGSGAVADVTTVDGPADLAAVGASAVRQWRFSPTGRESQALVGFNPAALSGDLAQPPVLVGGDVRPPVKIKDVKPRYPADAAQAGVQGVVILETRIAANGSVAEARILRSVALLDRAALDAVLGWKFSPSGYPIQMMVTVNFALRDDAPSPGIAGGVAGGVSHGVPGGVRGGVAGGVQGGVEGGVRGGVPGAPPSGAPLRVGGNIKAPEKTYDVKPVYPQEAKDAGIQGVVILEVTIGPDGKVMDAKVLRSISQLDQAAIDAVRQWEFVPTLLNGQAVPVIMTVTVNFTLQ